ncbi:uncharacterized protein J3D65DRAFT_665867 [Phyllosticta citribraziliensis]|uniref:F-box domain-containing protein n=1 Tax=Phyllosticta citribraziliensis TaxID=989973 RepID=A0ABR1M2Y7_9PEZI
MGKRRRATLATLPASKVVKYHTTPSADTARAKGVKQRHSTGRSILTRSKAALMRTQFPFLLLPAELRNVVYELALDFEGVVRTVNKHYEAHVQDVGYMHWKDLSTPGILMANKQISREALYVLHRQTLTIPHSTTPNTHITDIACRALLQNVRKVNITRDLRHGENHIWCDLLEFFQIIRSAVEVWNEDHHLQELTIDLNAAGVMSHLNTCPQSGRCYFLDEIKMLMETIQTLRGIKKVTIGGFLALHAHHALDLMKLPPAYLLKIPEQVRQRILGFVLDWNDADRALVRANRAVGAPGSERLSRMEPPITTPSIVLTNQQLSKEADMFLKVKPLTISAPPPRSTAPGTKIDNFITKTTLQQVRHLRLNIHSHGSRNTLQDWKYLFSELAEYLKVRHSLHTLHINIMDGEWVRAASRKESLWPSDWYGLSVLRSITSQRMSERKLQRVTWEGVVDEEEMSQLHTALAGEETTIEFPETILEI